MVSFKFFLAITPILASLATANPIPDDNVRRDDYSQVAYLANQNQPVGSNHDQDAGISILPYKDNGCPLNQEFSGGSSMKYGDTYGFAAPGGLPVNANPQTMFTPFKSIEITRALKPDEALVLLTYSADGAEAPGYFGQQLACNQVVGYIPDLTPYVTQSPTTKFGCMNLNFPANCVMIVNTQ